MTRSRRHRLFSIASGTGRSIGSANRSSDRCSDDGRPIRAQGHSRIHRVQTRAMSLSRGPSPAIDEEEWGWPPAEQSSLTWPTDDSDTVALADFAAAAGSPSELTDAARQESPAPSKPLAEDELDDDIAELRPASEKVIEARSSEANEPQFPPALATSPDDAASPAAAPAPEQQDSPPTGEDRHAIFGQLGRSMPHATSFQLGRFDVDKHLDMLEQGLSEQRDMAVATSAPSPASRELHDLDVLSEITALSEAAGVRPVDADDSDAFLRKVAEAQGSLAGLNEAHQDTKEEATDIEEEEEPSGSDGEDYSPFSDAEESEEEAPAENDDG